MYRPGEKVKRRMRMHGSSIRSVEVARGRTGYGFTLSGQAPCVLSCVLKGSPADFVGLKAGDKIFAINETNVKKASHEDVVKLIGKCSGILHMVIAERLGHTDSCSSDEEVGFYDGKGWLKPKPDSKGLGINRAEKVVEEMQSGGIFNMIFENSNICPDNMQTSVRKQIPVRETAAVKLERGTEHANSNPNIVYNEELPKTLNENSVFTMGLENQEYFGLDASILNVAMVVGYLGSIELPSSSSNLEYDSLQAIRGCMRRLRAEQKIHLLVVMKIMHDSIQLCSDKTGVITEYPAEKLAFSAICPDDRRFFGLVTMQATDDASVTQEDEAVLRTSCHVFMVDPELFHHKIHQGIARRFGFECTADPDTNGCLEFPMSCLSVLQFVSVLYRDMGELIEGVRARAFPDGDADVHQNNSMSSNSDSGIGNFNQEEKNNRVLVVDLGANSNKHALSNIQDNPVDRGQAVSHWNFGHEQEGNAALEIIFQNDKSQNVSKFPASSAHVEVPLVSSKSSITTCKKNSGDISHQRWLPVHVLKDWQHGCVSDQESYTDSTDGWSSVNCGTLPPPMSKIPADRYRVNGSFGQPPLMSQKNELSKKGFQKQNTFDCQYSVRKGKEDKKFGPTSGLVQLSQQSATRRLSGRLKRFSITRSLDDLESVAVSDGELNNTDLKDCVSDNSLSSNASLPSVQSCRRRRERRVASWAVSFERLLQDPVGIRYFSEFLRKEFSEENILFWQACEYFNHISSHDKQEIFNLMKFDSYTRFLKSALYQECILAEVEGRPIPDLQYVPSSPTSKDSCGSGWSNVSTSKKLSGKSKSGRSLYEDSGDEDSEKKKKGTFFSWSRSKSLGRSQKKKENGYCPKDTNGFSYRHESQESLSSAASLEIGSGPVNEKEKSSKCCQVNLSDGSSYSMTIRAGVSIKETLSVFCEKQGINIAAVDLFLVGGDKPLVLNQDSSILDSQALRLEKRTLFRLDLIPINRSVGLKAKPTKPVTEVLRPVVAKYGLNLNNLVARLNGEQELLDLGVPISNLDGQRVILDERIPKKGKDQGKCALLKQGATSTSYAGNQALTGEERNLGKSNSIKIKGESGKSSRDVRLAKREEYIAQTGKKLCQKINLDEAEEFFELISKVQSNRADDQRGLLRKEDLILPDFLHLPSSGTEPPCSTPEGPPGYTKRITHPDVNDKFTQLSGKVGFMKNSSKSSSMQINLSGSKQKLPATFISQKTCSVPFSAPLSPALLLQEASIWKMQSKELQVENIQTVEDENVADLTLVAEGDINSPNSTLLPPTPPSSDKSTLAEAKHSPPVLLTDNQEKTTCEKFKSGGIHRQNAVVQVSGGNLYEQSSKQTNSDLNPDEVKKKTFRNELPVNCIIDVDGVATEDGLVSSCNESEENLSFEGYVSELKSCQGRMRTGVYGTSDLPFLIALKSEKKKDDEKQCKATFV
uniref:Regulator of G protein signaling 12 n=1 Tax=Varanus komodoensis TaxID=61221 RepID=A0A8D2L035_VARKO